MNDAIRSALISAFALLAVAFAAATLGSTVTTQDGPSGPGNGGGGQGEGGPLPPPESGSPGETVVVPYLAELLTALAVLAALALLVYALLHRREALALLIVLALLLALIYFLFELVADLGGEFSPPPLDPGAGGPLGGEGDGDGTGGEEPAAPSTPSILADFVLLLAVAGGLIALVGRSSDDDARTGSHEADPSTAPDSAAVGRAAGRAADRVAGRETENEVYRAWREMTGLLDAPDPESRTPGEFADRAVEAGIGEADVEELTRLFEDVRYGERAASEEYERRAVETFRRIERRYAEDGS